MEAREKKRPMCNANRTPLGLLLSLGLLLACGSDDPGESRTPPLDADTPAPDADTAIPDDAQPSNAAARRGEILAQRHICSSCHLADYSGLGIYPNITQDDATGIGTWSDEEIANAIVHGVGTDGSNLCTLMPRTALSEDEAADLVAFLRTVPALENEITQACSDQGF